MRERERDGNRRVNVGFSSPLPLLTIGACHITYYYCIMLQLVIYLYLVQFTSVKSTVVNINDKIISPKLYQY